MIPKEMIEVAAQAQEDEWDRWIFRRKLDKSGYEAVREHDITAPISEENQTVYDLGRDPDEAKRAFTEMQRNAAAESALTAALSSQWRGMESAQCIAAYNTGLEDAARHCERNALSAIPVEIRGLKKIVPPPPAQE